MTALACVAAVSFLRWRSNKRAKKCASTWGDKKLGRSGEGVRRWRETPAIRPKETAFPRGIMACIVDNTDDDDDQ